MARLYEFLAEHSVGAATKAVEAIEDGILLLEKHPKIGRPLEDGLRELAIAYGATGHLALYQFDPMRDLVTAFKIRHQRELGYR